ncbi:MAG: alpha/beta fold hydrolase, partial [Simplicispira sp.]|nr:alpha/beta fold hydrolase [Simplicispira sp.]
MHNPSRSTPSIPLAKRANAPAALLPLHPAHHLPAHPHTTLPTPPGLRAGADWALHLALAPLKNVELACLALHQGGEMLAYLQERMAAGPNRKLRHGVTPPIQDRRFVAPEWQQWPFNLLHQSFLLTTQWWNAATHGVPGVDKHHEDVVAFVAQQWLDIFSPGNLLPTNPVVLRRTLEQGGANLVRGAFYALQDLQNKWAHAPPAGCENFVVGRDVAATPGKVVLKNRLMELIQYAPTTERVHPEPILIVPAWIMKYYILDLSPHNSLVRYLLGQGHTVFCISWKNPDAHDRHLGMEDYLQRGFHAALDAVNAIVPRQKVHATGYCLGGTLLTIAAAAMARDGDDRLASMTLLAAQTDFTEPGELDLFIDEDQLRWLQVQMDQIGYLKASQMAGAFQMLRSYDLLWSRMVNEYLLGERHPVNDLMAWNADATRMPAKMHTQYLRQLFLHNDLSEGRYPVHGTPVSLGDLRLPVFMVGTLTDHVAPWQSVFKLHDLSPAEITFVLTSGGHNAGVVNPPGNARRHYQWQTRPANAPAPTPQEWVATAPQTPDSWWPAWAAWLHARSGGRVPPPALGAAPHYLPLG